MVGTVQVSRIFLYRQSLGESPVEAAKNMGKDLEETAEATGKRAENEVEGQGKRILDDKPFTQGKAA